MFGILKAKWKLWAIGALIAVLSVAVWQWRAEIVERAQWAMRGEQLQQALEDAEERAAEERKERERVEDIAIERRERIEQLQQQAADTVEGDRELERNDEDVEEWASQRVPGPVIDRLRGESRADNGDGD